MTDIINDYRLTKTISLDFGGRTLDLDKRVGTPNTTGNVQNNGTRGSPPDKWIAHQMDVVIGLLAAVIVHSALHEGPCPWPGFVGPALAMLIFTMDGRTEIVVCPPHHSIHLEELLEEGQWRVGERWG